jgi:integrase
LNHVNSAEGADMSQVYNLTVEVIGTLPLPAKGKRTYFKDVKVRGLSLCVTAAGSRNWYFSRWAVGTSQRIHIGEYPGIKVDEARRQAELLNGIVAQREDPSKKARNRREEKTFGELFEWYLEHHAKVRKLSWDRDEQRFHRYLGSIARLPASAVTKGRVRELHAAVAKLARTSGNNHKTGIYAANHVLALISVVYSKAIAFEQYAGSNPAAGVQLFPVESRERILGRKEIEAFLVAVAAEPSELLRDYIYLSLCTGARRSNVLAMRWDEIDFEEPTWTIPRTKNGKPQVCPLEEAEMEILLRRRQVSKGPWVLPGKAPGTHLVSPGHGWLRIVSAAGIKDLRLHDLRRTLGSAAARQGVSLQTIGKMLGHKTMTATLVYARIDQQSVREAKRAAQGALFGTTPTRTETPRRPYPVTQRTPRAGHYRGLRLP